MWWLQLPISYVMMMIHGTDSAGEGKEVRAAKIVRDILQALF